VANRRDIISLWWIRYSRLFEDPSQTNKIK